jgi:transcriptional regulator with XRE-family HTH domain
MKWWQRLQQRMDELGWGKTELHDASGVSYDSINKYLRGDTEQPRGNVMQKLADAIGKPLLWLRDGIEAEESELKLSEAKWTVARKVGKVAAGLFREVDDLDQSEPEEITVLRDENFPNARQMTFEVEGDSMDALRPRPILPGDTIVCTAYEDIAHRVVLRDGMVVVVQRTRDAGMMREWSVKQIEIYEDRTEFHPRSTNPKHKPIVVQRQFDADDGVTVEVIGVVRMVQNTMPGF